MLTAIRRLNTRPKQLIFFYLWLFWPSKSYGHWQRPFFPWNRVCFCVSCSMVDMYASFLDLFLGVQRYGIILYFQTIWLKFWKKSKGCV